MVRAQPTMTPEEEALWEERLLGGRLWTHTCASCGVAYKFQTAGCRTCYKRDYRRRKREAEMQGESI